MKKKTIVIDLSITILSLVLAIIIGYVDYITGREIAWSFFYLIPVAISAWFSELPFSVSLSILSAVIWGISDRASGGRYSNILIAYWNSFMIFGSLIVTAVLLDGLKKALAREKAMARTDYLTDLENRRSFFETVNAEINRSSRNNKPFTIAYLDADNFKSINDNFGHETGDNVLKVIALCIKKNIRKMDTAVRLGGDEFAILLPETNAEEAKHAVDKIYMLLVEFMKSQSFPVTFSIGVVTFTNIPKNADEMIRIADEMMYNVKSMGKNNIKYGIS